MDYNNKKEELIKQLQHYEKQIFYIIFFQSMFLFILFLVLYFGYDFKTFSQVNDAISKSSLIKMMGVFILLIFFGISGSLLYWNLWQKGEIRNKLYKNDLGYLKRRKKGNFLFYIIISIIVILYLYFKKEIFSSILLWIFIFLLGLIFIIILFNTRKQKVDNLINKGSL